MQDIITVCAYDDGTGRVDITVQSRDGAAHSALSNLPQEDWEQIRKSIRWIIDGALARRKEAA